MIESDAGFSVERTRLCKLVYREGDKKVTLTIEHLVGPDKFIVYLAEYTDSWDPPFDTVRIPDKHWRKIGENIREAYRSQGIQIRVFLLQSQAERDALRRASSSASGDPGKARQVQYGRLPVADCFLSELEAVLGRRLHPVGRPKTTPTPAPKPKRKKPK